MNAKKSPDKSEEGFGVVAEIRAPDFHCTNNCRNFVNTLLRANAKVLDFHRI